MKSIVMVFACVALLWSCQNDDDGSPVVSEFSIKGEVEGNTLPYKQTVFDGGTNGTVNVYNRADKTLLLQSFKNGENDSEGFWTIRINGVDIENLTVPYSLTGVEGIITWVDESAKALQEPCSAADVLCFYSGVGVDEVKITITSVEDGTISGEFEGKLYHIRVNPSVIRDTDDVVEVAGGQFKIRFQTK
ncbi:hypothetical protein QQ020_28255 [Fulvivirgaceae bacterium BMA12]|uniref:Lipoprotein n=1 Tax=Agaribacillus aureus TaxID=3051825 RepID=A0ABT8LE06_9BACT|nr:hypothetical protein [Fulvivirgaceae bacterium BMA12]